MATSSNGGSFDERGHAEARLQAAQDATNRPSFVTVQPIADFPSRPRLLARGLTRRCAWCGDRKGYFLGWFKRQERCHSCGHSYRRGDEGFELGALVANMILTFPSVLGAALVYVVLTTPDVSVLGVVIAAGAVGLIGPAIFYPVSFTLWQAIDLWMRRPTPAELAGDGDATL